MANEKLLTLLHEGVAAWNARRPELNERNSLDLISADLIGANLTKAHLSGTVFATDLTGTAGLETCHHFGPSIIDFKTLEASPSLPLVFLRGIGLPDAVIDYLPSLTSQPIQFYSCFISYSAKDQEFVERLHADLQNKGGRCWFAPHDLRIGDKILDEIDAAIRLRDKVLLILSAYEFVKGNRLPSGIQCFLWVLPQLCAFASCVRFASRHSSF